MIEKRKEASAQKHSHILQNVRMFLGKNLSKKARKKIVVIGGGKGCAAVLSALAPYPVELSAVVAMADDGGSTGALRRELGVHPPGSVRPALVALAHNKDAARLFEYRFEKGDLRGHTVGNLVIAGFEKLFGDFERAVAEAGKILDARGKVVPSTYDPATLVAELADGSVVRGETEIDIPKQKNRAPIQRVWLEPKARLNPKAREAILRADMIVIGPGDLYTSIIPNFLVSGMPVALKKSRAKKVYVVNAINKVGETDGFTAGDFVHTIERYVGHGALNSAVVNKKIVSPACVRPENLLRSPAPVFADLLNAKSRHRYDQKTLANMLTSFVK